MSVLNCPTCASDQTQRLSAIVESGTSYTRGTSTGGFSGVGRGGAFGGVSSASINATTKSALASRLSAPSRKSAKRLMVFGVVLILLAFPSFHGFFLLGLIMLAGGGALIATGVKNQTWNNTVLPGKLAIWRDSFYCHRCQGVYSPAGLAAMGGPVLQGGGAVQPLPGTGVQQQLR
jgi:hypothetical protein